MFPANTVVVKAQWQVGRLVYRTGVVVVCLFVCLFVVNYVTNSRMGPAAEDTVDTGRLQCDRLTAVIYAHTVLYYI